MSLGALTSSLFITCDPVPQTVNVYTTVYTTTLLAACPTSSWMATYTITEVCTGDPDDYKHLAIPPCFVRSTVYCDVCKDKTLPIICPAPTMTADVVIKGNGVTAKTMPTKGSSGDYGGHPGQGGKSGSGSGGKESGDKQHPSSGGKPGSSHEGGSGSTGPSDKRPGDKGLGDMGPGDKPHPGKDSSHEGGHDDDSHGSTPPAKPAKTMDHPAITGTPHRESFVEAGAPVSLKQSMALLFSLATVAGTIALC